MSNVRFLMPIPCWICGDLANSSEHMVKASDIRSLFGHVSQNSRLFRHSKKEVNTPVKGAQASVLKFRPSLCGHCNSTRTQPHDRAWEELSNNLLKRPEIVVEGLRLPLGEVFSGRSNDPLLGIHFYFLKLLGCYAVEGSAPLPIKSFAVAILSGVPHPHLYIRFVAIASALGKPEVVVGDLQALHGNGIAIQADWFYIVGTIGVKIVYSEHGRPRGAGFWHPDDRPEAIVFA